MKVHVLVTIASHKDSDRGSGGHFAVSFTDSALGDAPGIRLWGVVEMARKTLVEGLT